MTPLPLGARQPMGLIPAVVVPLPAVGVSLTDAVYGVSALARSGAASSTELAGQQVVSQFVSDVTLGSELAGNLIGAGVQGIDPVGPLGAAALVQFTLASNSTALANGTGNVLVGSVNNMAATIRDQAAAEAANEAAAAARGRADDPNDPARLNSLDGELRAGHSLRLHDPVEYGNYANKAKTGLTVISGSLILAPIAVLGAPTLASLIRPAVGFAAANAGRAAAGAAFGTVGQAFSDLTHWRLSSKEEYLGAAVGGAASGLFLNSPIHRLFGMGGVGAVSNVIGNGTTQLLTKGSLDPLELFVAGVAGWAGGKTFGKVFGNGVPSFWRLTGASGAGGVVAGVIGGGYSGYQNGVAEGKTGLDLLWSTVAGSLDEGWRSGLSTTLTGATGYGVSRTQRQIADQACQGQLKEALGGRASIRQSLARTVVDWLGWEPSCFGAGTPLRTPDGAKAIELFSPGDLVLSRDENNPQGLVVAKVVEEVFTRQGLVWHLRVGGRVIPTTAEHPFYVAGKGWAACQELAVGDLLLCEDGPWVAVEAIHDTGEMATVYNLRVADFHTYFVGDVTTWGFSVWAHNACRGDVPERLAPIEESFQVPYGFKSHAEYKAFVARLRAALPEGAEPVFQGSAVTGRKYKTTGTGQAGDAFDYNRKSDYDIGIVHGDLFDAAAGTGLMRTKSDPPRIGPIGVDSELAGHLGLNPVLAELQQMAGRKVEFNLYRNLGEAASSSPTIYTPGGMFGGI